MTSSNARETTPHRRVPAIPSSSSTSTAGPEEPPLASYESTFYGGSGPRSRDERYSYGHDHPHSGDAQPGYPAPHWYGPPPSEGSRGSYNNSPAYGWSENPPAPNMGAGPSASYAPSGPSHMAAPYGGYPSSTMPFHDSSMPSAPSRTMAAPSGWRGDMEAGPSRTSDERIDTIDGKGRGLPVDHDLRQMTEIAVKGSAKGKERAREDEWEFGPPLNVREGMFAGKVLRFAARCVQQPLYGRRKTDKDRRPLAPVPIVRLRIRECILEPYDRGWREEDLDISTMEPSFLVCAVELSRPSDRPADSEGFTGSTIGPPDMRKVNIPTINADPASNWSVHKGATGPQSGIVEVGPGYPSAIDQRPTMHPGASFGGRSREPLLPMQYVERGAPPERVSLRHRASWVADGHWDTSSLAHGMQVEPTQAAHRAAIESFNPRRRGRDDGGTLYGWREEDGTDASGSGTRTPKRARAEGGTGFGDFQRNLYGTLHVTAVRVPDLEGVSGLWFLFTDTCVRQEGTYSLRFRVFDLSVVSPQVSPVPDLGLCESRTFKVYTPRNFPGLPKPTELSEHFVKQGFKLNTRKNERQVKSPSPSPPPPAGTSGV